MGRKLTVSGRIKKLEKLQRDLIIKKNPICALCQNKATVVDHLFSRNHKALFFYRDNLNQLCQGCHTRKTYAQGDASARLFFETRNRIGEERWNTMLDLLKKPFSEFRKTWYLDEQEKRLKELT